MSTNCAFVVQGFTSVLPSTSCLHLPLQSCDLNIRQFHNRNRRRRSQISSSSSSGPVIPTTCSSSSSSPTFNSPTSSTNRKMLVVDLQEALRSSEESEMRLFSERVEVDRRNSHCPTFVLFSSVSGYDASMKSIMDGGLIQPDALVTLSGTELYQRGYKTPDLYWSQQVQSGWAPKPVEWVLTKFFNDEIESINIGDDNNNNDRRVQEQQIMAVTIRCKGIGPSADFCQRVSEKLKLMGISSRVILHDGNNNENDYDVMVVPAAGSPSHVVKFCQMILGIEESSTFVFGGDELVNDCVQGKSNVGLCPAGTEQVWDAFDGRVYVSKENGVKALMDGVLHHAVF